MEQGVAGFAICDTDAAYSEKVKCSIMICILTSRVSTKSTSNKIFTFQTLLEWRGVFKEFSSREEERYCYTCGRGWMFLFVIK